MNRITSALLLAGLALAGLLALAPATRADDDEVIVIAGGRVHTMAGDPIEGGKVVIQDGKILAVGADAAPPAGAKVRAIDATGKQVLPGFIDAGTTLGLVEISALDVTTDTDEATDPVMPQLRVIDAYNPNSELIPVARINGITAVLSAPGETNLVSGQSAVVRLRGERLDQVLLRFPAAIHVNLGETPKAHFGEKKTLPSTRMGMAALLRETFIKAREYVDKWERFEEAKAAHAAKGEQAEGEPPAPPDRDLKLEALGPVLKGEIPLIVRAHRADDIGTALRLAEELDLRIVLRFATEGYQLADRIAARKIPVIVGPTTTQPETMETGGAIYENARRLHEAGVKIAIQTNSAHNVRNLPYEAGLAVTYGLPREAALRAVTLHPAQILGVADRIGSLQAGKDADVVVYDGDPFQPLTKVEHLFIGGEEVPLRSRQTELYERYRKK